MGCLLVAAFGAVYAPLKPVSLAFLDYVRLIGKFVFLGLLVGGLIDQCLPQSIIVRYLARARKRTILFAVLFGFLMSACCHGILAIAMALYKKGASTSAVVAFLLASPWANLPMTFLLVGFFGVKAFLFIGGALLIAVVTGLIFQVLEALGWVEKQPHVAVEEGGVSALEALRQQWSGRGLSFQTIGGEIRGVLQGMWRLAQMVLWWILIGMFVASLAQVFVPGHFFANYMGPTVGGLFTTLLAATIAEVCSEGTAPLAFELYRQTAAFGNVFVFLMAGVATDYTEIGLLWSNVGRRTAIWLPLVTVPQILVLGFLMN